MGCTISVIIPNWNGEATIAQCLEAVLASRHDSFEVIVVDDCSDDKSIEIIKQYPCRLVQLMSHQGTATARNVGANHGRGELLFFTDGDCVIVADTLSRVEKSYRENGTNVIVGGTYTCVPYDTGFFSVFQAVFVNYSEIKNKERPDYLATHAMVISGANFKKSGGFLEDFYLPILEDVEYSHHLKEQGFQLLIDPELQVRHIFNFSLITSIKNAFRKSKFWTIYSLENRDLLKDSGCASCELKLNFISLVVTLILLFLQYTGTGLFFPVLVTIPTVVNLIISRSLLKLYYQTGGIYILLLASVYYVLIYSAVVGIGGLAGLITNFSLHQKRMFGARVPLHNSDN